ncbi:hypothetical protein KKF59_02815 [Patescibacteria group bacterium]|nr:hypothetical protein [Patescibacteria group bacterium]MBU1034985.1 hypothetical protein [Patescibacteria group bacterium]MBU1630018.1 hypothetical protein [Patescibacteria group bacterium]MBU1908040.1 hypothetical protein [Patescibacteria group bacterium]
MEEIVFDTTTASTPWLLYFFTAIIVVAGIAYGLWRLKRALTRPEMFGLTREEIQRRWKMIRETAKQGTMGAKVAIMEADTLLDSALKSMTMPGQTLGERLKMACYKYPNLKKVWWAHKLRNQLVHEATFQLGSRQAHQALDEFEKALKTLNLL